MSDVTYFSVFNRMYYICVVLDLYARKVISNKISQHNSTQLTKTTVKAAYGTRKPTESLLFHSDQGGNYTSSEFRKYLKSLISYNRFQIRERPTTIWLWSLSSVVLSEKHYIATVSKRKKIFSKVLKHTLPSIITSGRILFS